MNNQKIKITHKTNGLVDVVDYKKITSTVKPWQVHHRFSDIDVVVSSNELQMQTTMEADSSVISYFKSLKIGGEFHVIVPDLDYFAKIWLDADWTEKKLRDINSRARQGFAGVFGTQRGGNPLIDGYDSEHSDCHRSGYNKRRLEFLLNRVGFVDVNVTADTTGILNGYGKKTMQRGERQISQNLDNIRKDHLNRYTFAADILKKTSPQTVLDLACGIGYGSSILHQALNVKVTGIDIDQGSIDYARKYYADGDVEFICQNAQNLMMESESFDAIVSFETIEHVTFDQELISTFYTLLKPQGVFICSTPNEDVQPFNLNDFPYHIKHYKNSELIDILKKSGFNNIELFAQTDPVNGEVVSGQNGCFTIAVASK